MNKKTLYLFVLFVGIMCTNVRAQYESRGKEFNYVDAESFYNLGNYYEALPLYEILRVKVLHFKRVNLMV